MDFQFLDTSKYVPKNFPDLEAKRNEGCPKKPWRWPRIDYVREHFCGKWGPNFPCLCPPRKGAQITCRPTLFPKGVGDAMDSLEYFTWLPSRPEGHFPSVKQPLSVGQRMGLHSETSRKNPTNAPWSTTCASLGARLKPDLMKGASVCGTCFPKEPETEFPFNCDDRPVFDLSPDLPFTVYMAKQRDPPSPPKLRTGVGRCLQPSQQHLLNSVTQLEYTDFRKVKTKKQISVYRSPLALDKRRPKPSIPCNEQKDMVINVNKGPLDVKAQYIRYLPKKKEPFNQSWNKCNLPFQIQVPGPINLLRAVPIDQFEKACCDFYNGKQDGDVPLGESPSQKCSLTANA